MRAILILCLVQLFAASLTAELCVSPYRCDRGLKTNRKTESVSDQSFCAMAAGVCSVQTCLPICQCDSAVPTPSTPAAANHAHHFSGWLHCWYHFTALSSCTAVVVGLAWSAMSCMSGGVHMCVHPRRVVCYAPACIAVQCNPLASLAVLSVFVCIS